MPRPDFYLPLVVSVRFDAPPAIVFLIGIVLSALGVVLIVFRGVVYRLVLQLQTYHFGRGWGRIAERRTSPNSLLPPSIFVTIFGLLTFAVGGLGLFGL